MQNGTESFFPRSRLKGESNQYLLFEIIEWLRQETRKRRQQAIYTWIRVVKIEEPSLSFLLSQAGLY